MAVARRHSLYGVELDTDAMAGTAVVLGGIKGQVIEAETEVRNDTSSGEVYPTHLAMVSQKIMATFRTTSIAVALDNIGLTGLLIAGASQDGVNLYAYKHAEGGTRASGSNHRKYTVKEGIIVPQRITCEHQADATIEYRLLSTYDGTNDPIVVADSSAVPTNGADLARFTIGGCTIESVAISHIISWEIDFGVVIETEGADSDKWDTHVSIRELKPVLRLRGRDAEWLKSTAIPLGGKAATHANTTLFLRKRSTTASGFVADATSEHVSFTAAGLAHITTIFDAESEGNPPAEFALEMPLYFDGTNAPLVIDTTAAIA